MGKRFKFVLQDMENSVSSARLPLLDDKNYSYWKVRVVICDCYNDGSLSGCGPVDVSCLTELR